MASSDERGVDEVLARLRQESEDLPLFLNVFAAKMEATLPGSTRIRRSGLLGGGQTHEVSVSLGDALFTMRRKAGTPPVECTRSKEVSGVVLKSEVMSLGAWLDALVRALAAKEAESGQDVLSAFLLGPPSS